MRQKQSIISLFLLSPSSRRAWIEISVRVEGLEPSFVALLAEGVDRNGGILGHLRARLAVALLAEGVDRNIGLLPD